MGDRRQPEFLDVRSLVAAFREGDYSEGWRVEKPIESNPGGGFRVTLVEDENAAPLRELSAEDFASLFSADPPDAELLKELGTAK